MATLKTKTKIAVWLNIIDPVFLTSQNLSNCYLLVLNNTLLAEFALKNYPAEKIILLDSKQKIIYPSFSDIISKTDVINKLANRKIRHLILPHKSSDEIEKWAKSNDIKLIGPAWSLQRKLENKQYFDDLLKKHKISSPKTISGQDIKTIFNGNKSYVIQKQESFGMFGTYFYSANKKSKKPKINYTQTLIREYLPGVSVGVSIFLDNAGGYLVSGLRRQCFTYKNGFPKYFLGVQWLPSNFFPAPVNKKINFEIKKLIILLQSLKFSGVANVDLLIYKSNPYIIECNPRLSSATPQIFSVPELTDGENSWRFFINSFFSNGGGRIQKSNLPRHNFAGSILDIDLPRNTKIKNILKPGTYRVKNGKIEFVSELVKDFIGCNDCFFLFHEITSKNQINRDFTLATLISNFPLFNQKTGGINNLGLKLSNYFKKEFIN